MTYTAPDLSEVLSNEQELNSKLINCKIALQNILDENSISYQASEGIIPLIRKLPYPIPTTVELNNNIKWLTLSGPQTSNKICRCYPIVRDQSGSTIDNIPITIRRKAINGGSWSTYGSYTSGNPFDIVADANKGGYIYECYITDNPSISSQITLPQYYFNYDGSGYSYNYLNVLDTSNLLISNNVRSIDTMYLSYGYNYFDIVANNDGEMLVAIALKNTPTIIGANNNTNIYIGYDVTRGNTSYSDGINGVGGGMVGNGSRNSMGIFLDASDKDLTSTYGTSFDGSFGDYGYTESGSSKECIVRIPGGNTGAYTFFENADASISNYGPYWYSSMIGSNYAPCVVVNNTNMSAGQKLRVKIKYIRAVAP
ncbi:MAG: hypothetical protein HUK28_07615 [Methanobrevibacter sp.]|nr:hypothetical protein [Methanobrevibacter sp.]